MKNTVGMSREKYCVSLSVVQDIVDYLEAHLMKDIVLSELGQHFFMHTSTINQAFKLVCQMTIMEYVRNRRLTLAGQSLLQSNISIIELAYLHKYETPESFTKAFTRFHSFPPSLVRRSYPTLTEFNKINIKLNISGGWLQGNSKLETNVSQLRQDNGAAPCYSEVTKALGGMTMEHRYPVIQLNLDKMQYQHEWEMTLRLNRAFQKEGISFKVDGKNMIFVHGVEFQLEKLCYAFKWGDEALIKRFFNYEGDVFHKSKGFKYFDTMIDHTIVRCMFFGDCPGDETDEFLYNNTNRIQIDGVTFHSQSIQFYYENGNKNDIYYEMVKQYIEKNKL